MKQKTFYLNKSDFIITMNELKNNRIAGIYDEKGQRYSLMIENDKIIAYKNPNNIATRISFKNGREAFLAVNSVIFD